MTIDFDHAVKHALLAIITTPGLDHQTAMDDPVAHADARTSTADWRIAANIARGHQPEHIDPGTGYVYTDTGYATSRQRHQEQHAWQIRQGSDLYHIHHHVLSARETQRDFLEHRPDLDSSDWFPCHTAKVCVYCELADQ